MARTSQGSSSQTYIIPLGEFVNNNIYIFMYRNAGFLCVNLIFAQKRKNEVP